MSNVTLLSASSAAAGGVFIVIMAVISLLLFAALVVALTKTMAKSTSLKKENEGKTKTAEAVQERSAKLNIPLLLAFVLGIGLIVRLVFTMFIRGYIPESNLITSLITKINKDGFINNYYANRVSVYPVLYFVYAFLGLFTNAFSLTASSIVMPFIIKLPFIICDIFIAILLYKAAKKYMNAYAGIALAAFYSFCPLFIFSSAVWGSMLHVVALFLGLSLYFVAQKKYARAMIVYSVALLSGKEALYLFPLFAVFFIYHIVKGIIAVKKSGNFEFKAIIANAETKNVVLLPVLFVVNLIVMYLICLPLTIDAIGASFFEFFAQFFLRPLTSFTLFGRNSLSIFNLFLKNGADLGATFPSLVFSIVFTIIITAIVIFIYLSKKNRANLVFLGGYLLFTIATYYVDATELTLIPAIIIFLLSFILIKDKRILQIGFLTMFLMLLNASAVMANGGLLELTENISGLTDKSYLLSSGALKAFNIVCSTLVVLTHFYATLLLLDLAVSNKRRLFIANEKATFAQSITGFVNFK